MFRRKERGVHRGSLSDGALALLEKILRGRGLNPSRMRLEGSLARGNRGSRGSDFDVSYPRPRGMSDEELSNLEREIQDVTGVDFYFRE